MAYIGMQAITMTLQVDTTGSADVWSVVTNLYQTNLQQNVAVSAVSSVIAPAGMILAVLGSVLQVVFLYYPAIFQGLGIWMWWLLCFPVAISFIVVIILAIRGNSST